MQPLKIYQIELSSFCNAKCPWCMHDSLTRTKSHMSLETVKTIIKYLKSIGQTYIALHHMGEPMLNPYFFLILKMFDDAEIGVEFSTNGLLLPLDIDDIINCNVKRVRIAVDYFGFYSKNVNNPAFNKDYFDMLNTVLPKFKNSNTQVLLHTLKENALDELAYLQVNNPHITIHQKELDNWAGQVDGESQLTPGTCFFKSKSYVVVLADGSIVPCCMDGDGKHIIGHINTIQDVAVQYTYTLCNNCVGMQFATDGEWE